MESARLACVEWHSLRPRALGADSVVLDLGANRGRFSQKMVDRFGSRCFAVEASAQMYDTLHDTDRIQNFHCAITGRNGQVAIYPGDNELAASTSSGDGSRQPSEFVDSIRLDDFVDAQGIGRIDLLKMDIEGAEVEVFDSLSDEFLRGIAQISVEFHDFCGLVSEDDVARIVARLEGLGFHGFKMSRNGHQDTLFVNRALLPMSELEAFYIRHVARHALGVMRVVLRAMKVDPDRYPYYN